MLHLKRLHEQDGPLIAGINAVIAELGGEMLPLQDGTPPPAPSRPGPAIAAPVLPAERGGPPR